MRVFLAGATGVLGMRLVPLLVGAGHEVAGMSRSATKDDLLRDLGAEPVVCDVFDRERLVEVVRTFRPDVVLHELTDLPDEASQIASYGSRNSRMRTEGTRNLLDAAAGVPMVAQSVAWELPGEAGEAAAAHEAAVLAAEGVVVRYGQLYGPGTYFPSSLPAPPRIHVDEAASRTVPLLGAPSGVVVLVDADDATPG